MPEIIDHILRILQCAAVLAVIPIMAHCIVQTRHWENYRNNPDDYEDGFLSPIDDENTEKRNSHGH